MLEGRELILATNKYTKEDRGKSWMYMLSTYLLMLGAIAGTYWNFHWAGKVACSILAGLLIVRMFVIYHDYLHGSILQNSTLAKILFTIYGYYILASPSIWQRSHEYHHNHNSKLYTSSIGSFPIVTKKKFNAASAGERAMYLFIRHPLTIALGYIFAFIYGMSIRSLLHNPTKHWDSAVAMIFHFGISACVFIFLGWQAYVLSVLIPALISSGIGAYLFYAQHNFPDAKFADKENWDYVQAALKSSSFMKLNPVMNWFTANIGYHHIHHVNSRIPFYRLPEVYKDMEEFHHAGRTSLTPTDIWKCCRLKVWDPEQNRMLGLKEAKA